MHNCSTTSLRVCSKLWDTHALERNSMGALEVRTLRGNSITILRSNADLSWNQLKYFSQLDLEAFFKSHWEGLYSTLNYTSVFISSCINNEPRNSLKKYLISVINFPYLGEGRNLWRCLSWYWQNFEILSEFQCVLENENGKHYLNTVAVIEF